MLLYKKLLLMTFGTTLVYTGDGEGGQFVHKGRSLPRYFQRKKMNYNFNFSQNSRPWWGSYYTLRRERSSKNELDATQKVPVPRASHVACGHPDSDLHTMSHQQHS